MGLLGLALVERDIGYVTYDGDMSPRQRETALEKVRSDEECSVLLMSIMAGGAGLNITSCNHVILMEPWWNPFVESQACDRVYRIGQAKPVFVYLMIVEDSIEQVIVETQEEKRKNVKSVMGLCPVLGDGNKVSCRLY
ncbi:hypothetical protein JAAARDRAFT_530354 [Jaapia argillacea MUCL 33604]|uniref:Helicase C-terminal domain-containing protein n=1 Tax=Jaapia argillacea MUCL 33604 TaxID=933084 RepID=A0A067P979_9AGAM|nr:hypothetical protein JAAARDRAFT_530354 [Jaapia argillacea MUCL 33604]